MLIRILLVEDDVLQADLTCRMLEAQRFYVEVASSGLDAVRKILAGWFDVVLMDHYIPDFDGVTVGRIIVDLGRSNGRPRLIALSAAPETIHATEAEGSSVFDAIISKPWNPAELVAAIRRCHQMLPPATHRMEALQPSLPIRPVQASPGKTVSVLVIDDDMALRTVVCLALETSGYAVEQATNGLDALRKVVTTAFDVVVLDYQIPLIDGLAAGRLIFDLIPTAERPRLVALTSSPERLTAREAGELSVFDEVVGKHDGIMVLLAAIDRCSEYKALRTRIEPPEVVRLDSIFAMALDKIYPRPQHAPVAPIERAIVPID